MAGPKPHPKDYTMLDTDNAAPEAETNEAPHGASEGAAPAAPEAPKADTFEEDAPRTAGDNSAALDHIKRTIRTGLAKAQKVGLESLTAYRDVGDSLAEAKGVLPKGEFGPWCEAEFGFSKEWRARLMKLAGSWKEVLEAHAWAKSLGRVLGRKEYSVDGALALVAEHAKVTDPELAAKAEAKAAEREAKKAEAKASEETELETLRRLFKQAMDRIADLEEALEKASKSGGDKASKAPPKDAPKADGPTITAADKAKARKVHGLYTRGGTDGEKDAAKARLTEMAGRYNMALDAFLSACGLSV